MSTENLRDGWTVRSLESIAVEVMRRVPDPRTSGLERFVSSSCIDRHDVRVTRWEATSEVISAAKRFESGDYLLVRRSLYATDFRERAPRADFAGVCSADILTIRERDGEVAPGFLQYLLYDKGLWDFIVANSTGSITRRIKWKQIAKYEFTLPPLDDQLRTVELLSALDSLAARHEVLEASIAATKTAYFAGQWSCVSEADLGQIGKVATGKTPPTGDKRCWEPPEVPFLAPGDFNEEVSLLSVTERHVSKSGSAVAGVIPPYSVVQVCIGWSSGKVGIVLRECSSNQQVNSLQGLDPIDATYVASALASAEGRQRFARVVGTQNFPMVRKSDWSRIRIPWPDRASRESVVQRIHHLGELERSTQENRLKVYALRHTLLERCLTGVDSRVH